MLAGCASQNSAARANIPHDVDDANYVATVENYDRSHGIDVHWVNPPQKRVPEKTSTGDDQ
jgi:hypothetical protein